MAVLEIKTAGDPVLKKFSEPVKKIDKRIKKLLDDMAETMYATEGIGIAAPQVGVSLRMVVVDVGEGLIELINPTIIKRSDEIQEGFEGCLSLPNRWGITERPMTVTVRAQDRNGKLFEMTGTGLLAKAFCHELDHLDGILYSDVAKRMLTRSEMIEEGLIDG